MSFDHRKIELKWQKYWEKEGLYQAKDFDKRLKQYILIEFPYPSGERLHVGHGRSYCCLDAVARLQRMKGRNVLFPIGWDAFGLPAENYAIKTGIHPSITTKENIANAKKQAQSWGLSFDWEREINTTDPDYYRWTQWIFLQLYQKGLAYKAEIPVNWCPKDKTNLADEEVVAGKCERCGTPVERRTQSQWLLKITAYADRLIDDLETVDYREDIKAQQVNWIGRSEGARIRFPLSDSKDVIEVFTTRPDTLYGATFLVISPEKAQEFLGKEIKPDVKKYIEKALGKSELQRQEQAKEKTGVFSGFYA
ncbi:MAG: class I tRNA ligase family protein, partial [Patescibacteria group bacterium]